ncbi:hypothetical protein DFJ77DRAFT_478646 [Powellomyces hirtus]|nr:hypothetical protein DFJ77DRAFT_478646 [Powellomyces hirtus]
MAAIATQFPPGAPATVLHSQADLISFRPNTMTYTAPYRSYAPMRGTKRRRSEEDADDSDKWRSGHENGDRNGERVDNLWQPPIDGAHSQMSSVQNLAVAAESEQMQRRHSEERESKRSKDFTNASLIEPTPASACNHLFNQAPIRISLRSRPDEKAPINTTYTEINTYLHAIHDTRATRGDTSELHNRTEAHSNGQEQPSLAHNTYGGMNDLLRALHLARRGPPQR